MLSVIMHLAPLQLIFHILRRCFRDFSTVEIYWYLDVDIAAAAVIVIIIQIPAAATGSRYSRNRNLRQRWNMYQLLDRVSGLSDLIKDIVDPAFCPVRPELSGYPRWAVDLCLCPDCFLCLCRELRCNASHPAKAGRHTVRQSGADIVAATIRTALSASESRQDRRRSTSRISYSPIVSGL